MTRSHSNEIRIPTLLALSILIVGLGTGVILVSQKQLFKSQAGPTQEPKNITVANISATSASIYWQTDKESTSIIKFSNNPSLEQTYLDDRDTNKPNQYKLHFVTLSDLKPQTTYYFKIVYTDGSYPSGEPLSFQTSSQLAQSMEKPLIGRVLDNKLEPVTEAIITLEMKGAQRQATITKIAGNFILPLADLKTEDLSTSFNTSQVSPKGKLIIFSQNSKSVVNLKLPVVNPILPTITLGKDLDLTLKATSPSAKLPSATASASTKKYDLNQDGVINALDYSIVVDNLGKIKRMDADINYDGLVDQQDLDLLSKIISGSIR